MAPESDQQDIGDDVRKKALVRLMVAGLVTATALGGLWWIDQDNQKKPEKSPQPAHPTPILPAKTAEIPLPQAATPETGILVAPSLPVTAPDATPDISPKVPSTPPTGSRGNVTHEDLAAFTQKNAPPPPRVHNVPREAAPSAVSAFTQKPPQAPLPAPPNQPNNQPNTPFDSPLSSSGISKFLVQLGVFSNPSHAQELVQRLRKQGIQARTETRVHIGPFANEREAEKARAEMRRQGLDAVITPVAARK